MFNRLLKPSLSRSFFLFGARSTGKSTLLESFLPEGPQTLWIDLLDYSLEERLVRQPQLFVDMIDKRREEGELEWVVVDEVQKIPGLLSYVHRYIQKHKLKFALTGSSARKLKRGGADLLAGRASNFELFPLIYDEWRGSKVSLDSILRWGSLPEVFSLSEEDKTRFLRSYTETYLKEEILQEQVIRKTTPFRKFLELAALHSGRIVNYSAFARDVGAEVPTIQSYFEILQDTLVGYELPSFHRSIRKRQKSNPKFFFFDLGVTRALSGELGAPPVAGSSAYGFAFEQFFILEVLRKARTLEKDWRLSYLCTRDGAEIDLIIEKGRSLTCIEIKSAPQVDPMRVGRFEKLAGEFKGAELLYVSQDRKAQKIGKVECLHWPEALQKIFE